MTSPEAPDPETLRKLAAQLNPQLACDDPAKAIELARKLLIAADPELAKQEADRAEEMQLLAETQRHDELFPRNELISVAEAFKALPPGHYKTETRFAAALRKEKLTTYRQDVDFPQWRKALPHEGEKFVKSSEVTTMRAVNKLFRRQHEAKQENDRARKAATKQKNQQNVAELQEEKAEQIRQKAELKRQKVEATKQKAEDSEGA